VGVILRALRGLIFVGAGTSVFVTFVTFVIFMAFVILEADSS